MANSEDVLERAESWLRHDAKEPPAWLVARLADMVRELRRDRARLDWLGKQSEPSWSLFGSATWQSDPCLRDAIDAAMGGGEGEA
jgi:hypothetical protein